MPDKKQRRKTPEGASLADEMAARIRRDGPVTVAEFMEKAASRYYASKMPFGAEGDFTTAPEVSQMFGEMIGVWFVDIWLQTGQPDKVQLIELGPGRGTLMADIMRTISAWPAFKAAVSIHLVESSPHLRQEQATALKAYRPTWYDRLEEVPASGAGFIVANEFFDALPVHQFKKVRDGWVERCVGYDEVENSFHFTTAPVDFDIAAMMPPEFMEAPEGGIFEISPSGLAVLETVCQRIAAQGGAGLIVDYGHAQPGLGDTLQSVHRQKYSDVLEGPGTKDITAHLDFATFKTVARQSVRVHGPVMQGEFLTALGIAQRAESLSRQATEQQRQDMAFALRRLTAASEMGQLFKVMGLTPRESEIIPAGFNDEISDDPLS